MLTPGKEKVSVKHKHDGVSLRTIQVCLISVATVFLALMLIFTFYLSTGFENLTENAEQHVELRKSALDLMDASDYLTEKAQRFTLYGETQFLDDYFEESLQMHHREDAIAKLSKANNANALKKLQAAFKGSVKLMEREYYAMRLVVDAKGYTDYPKQLNSVTISKADMKLSPEDKMDAATKIVLGNDYYLQKNEIRANTRACLTELEEQANLTDAASLKSVRNEMLIMRIIIVVQTIGVLLLVWLTSHWGIHPILDAVERIKENKNIKESGTSEFRYLIRAYNRMYHIYKKSLERLNFKASHDELTKVYNRAGYDSIISEIDFENTYMILIDIDDFKSINDTYGHETGDKVLIKTAQILKNNFRSDDYICRIGGDEFVVFMMHADDKNTAATISEKIDNINRQLSNTDGLPAISLSVGIVHGSQADSAETLFMKADEAMYNSKHRGKNTYTFTQ